MTTGIWHHIKDLPEGSVVRLYDAGEASGDVHRGEVVYICHHERPEPDGSRDTCVGNGEGEHWPVLSRAMVELIRLRSDLACDYIKAMSQ